MMNRPLAIFIVGSLLVGCASDKEDLDRWMNAEQKQMRGSVKPLPKAKTFPTVEYQGGGLESPFSITRIDPEPPRDGVVGGPDLTRQREPLEAFPLESIVMVGTIEQDDRREALVFVADTVHTVKVGSYIGQDYGVITEIKEGEITLTELIEDLDGNWTKRTSTLLLQEQSE